MKTMLLDTEQWDIVLDANGNWAAADDPYALAQDVASSLRTFVGEAWYGPRLGVPYWQAVLGKAPPPSLVKAKLENAALQVPGVVEAVVYLTGYETRSLGGYCLARNKQGVEATVAI